MTKRVSAAAQAMATIAELKEKLDASEKRRMVLVEENVKLKEDIAERDPENSVGGRFVMEQIESLADAIWSDRPSTPRDAEQLSRCLKEILAGRPWEFMTWR